MRARRLRDRIAPLLPIYALVGISIVLLDFPIYWMVKTSLAPNSSIFVYPPHLLPTGNSSLGAYGTVVHSQPILRWITNSGLVVLGVEAITLVLAILAAYSLSRFPGRGANGVSYFMLASRMLPTTMLIIPLFIVMKHLHLINSLGSLVIADTSFTLPFAVWMLKGYFDSIPREIDEAAQIDGSSPIGALCRVVLRLAAPGVVATILYTAIVTWDEYLFARTFLNDDSWWTMMVGLSAFKGEYITAWNELMAASLIGALPVMILFLFVERYMVSGLTAGAIK